MLVAVGDIRLDGPVAQAAGKDPGRPTSAARAWLSGDIVFGNLEQPVTERGSKTAKTWNFRAAPQHLSILKAAGFQVVSLANNHVFDYGRDGLVDTLDHVRQAGIRTVGAGRDRAEAEAPEVVEARGLKVAFLAFTSTFPDEAWAGPKRPGVAFGEAGRVAAAVAAARKRADVVVVSFHGGTELDPEPNAVQKAFARNAVRAGADLVIGHHPHVLQPVEIVEGKPVLHSLGNFLFVSPTPTTRATAAARVTLTKAGVKRIDFVPFDVNFGSPAPFADAGRARDRLDRWAALTLNPELLGVVEAR